MKVQRQNGKYNRLNFRRGVAMEIITAKQDKHDYLLL